jgi:glutaredoxin
MTSRSFAGAVERARTPVLLALLLGLALPAAALYKVVGPDGRVSYSDRPPTDGAARVNTISRGGTVNETTAPERLPSDLRQLATRFPVTLYVAADCLPCDAGRELLTQRGVPFSEKRVASDDDAAALERAVGVRTVPSLTIGQQVLRGLSQPEWNAYLDAAGYPRESRLPRGWQQPVATPLVQSETPRTAGRAPIPPAEIPPPAASPSPPPPASPSGIRF